MELLPTHEHPLSTRNGIFRCHVCVCLSLPGGPYLFCSTCNVSFHKECAEHYSVITSHPYHPIHPLEIRTRKQEYEEDLEDCLWCKGWMKNIFYHCPVCNLNIHLFCANKSDLVLTLDPGKNHDHPLKLFPRRMTFSCNICGVMSNNYFPIYACVECDFMVHEACLKQPRVIKISRHQHRISRRLYLPPGKWSCGVCHGTVNARYGAFFCTKGCGYAVHTKCATSPNVWDEKELEDVPEILDEIGDVDPYEVIDENTIKHFSHEQHHLRLVDCNGFDDDKMIRCHACCYAIEVDKFYKCDHCDFNLHQKCANYRKKIWHPVHRHLLVLRANDDDVTLDTAKPSSGSTSRGLFLCSTCNRYGSGFMYICLDKRCDFEVDVRCASMSEPFNHKSHQHPLFFNWKLQSEVSPCGTCESTSNRTLSCLLCPTFSLCFECATFPDEVVYKDDEHPLILCCGNNDGKGLYSCGICKEELDPKKWFYKCEDCAVTLHMPCLLGRYPHLKPDSFWFIKTCGGCSTSTKQTIEGFEIVANNSLSRPVYCNYEHDHSKGNKKHHCQGPLSFKHADDFYCSFECLYMGADLAL